MRELAVVTRDLDLLTPRQIEVAQLAARGLTNGEIADELAISENTVKRHLKVVFARVAVRNRTELAKLLFTRA